MSTHAEHAEFADGTAQEVDADLEAELAALAARDGRPSEHQLAGGAPRSFGILVAVLGAIGTFSSAALLLSEMTVLANPNAQLACDINPLIGCGDFLATWQSRLLFGIPNGLVGSILFAALTAIGVALAAGARVPRWFWLALLAGVWGAGLLVLFFMGTAFFVVRALCPYCVVIWLSVIPLVTQTTARTIQGGHLSVGERLGGLLVRERWVLTAILYSALALVVLIVFWDSWAMMLAGTLR